MEGSLSPRLFANRTARLVIQGTDRQQGMSCLNRIIYDHDLPAANKAYWDIRGDVVNLEVAAYFTACYDIGGHVGDLKGLVAM